MTTRAKRHSIRHKIMQYTKRFGAWKIKGTAEKRRAKRSLKRSLKRGH